tara:strand:- start:4104 stop:4988 length:885 start_codon:yes stop_codon:yes gene_type:complete
MRKITVVADLFLDDFVGQARAPGGAELHDDVVVKHFESMGLLDECVHSTDMTPEYVLSKKDNFFFIANFGQLLPDAKAVLYTHCDYVIYEHDYKFSKNRNPISFPNFVIDKWLLTNYNFYKKAKKIITLSQMHRDIFENNLDLTNITNINCSMWSDEHLEKLKEFSKKEKTKFHAIVGAGEHNKHIKRADMAVKFCKANRLSYEVISDPVYENFLDKLSSFSGLVFITGHPEPTPRLVMEAKMMNCEVIAQSHLIGVAHEPYFSLSGVELIEKVREMRDTALRDIIMPEVTSEV